MKHAKTLVALTLAIAAVVGCSGDEEPAAEEVPQGRT